MSEWNPIETAPKDGTYILAYSPLAHEFNYSNIRVTYYRRSEDKQGFIGWGEFNSRNWPPTHWMPLPEPPNAK